MLKKIFTCGSALLLFGSVAWADCETKEQVQEKLLTATVSVYPDYKITIVTTTDATVIKSMMDSFINAVGNPPFSVDSVKEIDVFKPNDLTKFDVYISFMDDKGCKLDHGGLKMPGDMFQAVLKQASA